jgi:hypothetical protein
MQEVVRMNSLPNDREVQVLMRDFLMCCNRTENAESKGSEDAVMSAMHEQRRAAAARLEEVLTTRGWVAPTTLISPVRLPETAKR